ncbi:hypothetical protein Fuma_01515 [Fuerstiella marisgermanici]|uniref:Uncharacterized protein n=1 Tax=Fuerstiella marisgermanici TaxID=1891926 RepID=A0A1P8WD03_9PLAN|nr:hypothetical protein Fuma_01515 [Fuerstiella marisgermanici]
MPIGNQTYSSSDLLRRDKKKSKGDHRSSSYKLKQSIPWRAQSRPDGPWRLTTGIHKKLPLEDCTTNGKHTEQDKNPSESGVGQIV